MPKSRVRQNVRVGVFVTGALFVFGLAVLVIGQERSMFVSRTHLHTRFADVNGLVVGAPVRLAGLDVGRVIALTFEENLERTDARVELAVEDAYLPRLRRDSYAYIDSKGLLGDKLINLTVGSPNAAPLADGDFVPPKQGVSFEAIAKELETTASAIGRTAERTTTAVDDLVTPELAQNLQRVSGSLATLLERVESGEGLAHDLLFDPQLADRVGQLVASASTSTRRLDAIMARIERGPGGLHALVYDDGLARAVASLERAGEGVAETTDQINHGPGLATALLRDPEGRKLVRDLAEVGGTLNRIASHVERGEGTVGGLLVDPSVYEDMKTVLGNIERNTVLKALIRLTIREDDIQRPAVQARPAAPPTGAR